MKLFANPCSAHAEGGVPALRSANSYPLRPETPPSAESVESRVARSAMDH